MRPPVGKSWEDFRSNWYSASKFGEDRRTYIHNGEDLNLRTGGDSDLGQPLYAVLPGNIAYYHKGSHPTRTYGIHCVLECDTPKGKRWFHYAHTQDFTVSAYAEGAKIGTLGKSGTSYAHLHFSVFKVDPKTLPNGIDTIAKTKQQLADWWEDPADWLKENAMGDNALESCLKDREMFWNERDALLRELNTDSVEGAKSVIAGFKSRITDLGNQVGSLQAEVKNREEQVGRLKENNLKQEGEIERLTDRLKEEVDLVNEISKEKGSLVIEVEKLKVQVETLKKQGAQGGITPETTIQQLINWLKDLFIRN